MIADSRGREMGWEMDHMSDIGETNVITHPGADIITATRRSIETLRRHNPNLVILHAGICDITKKDRNTGVITLKSTDSTRTVNRIMATIDTAYRLIRSHGNPTVSISTITGVDLSDINSKQRRLMSETEYQIHNKSKRPHDHHNLLNDMILAVNRRITAFNEINSTPTAGRSSPQIPTGT